MTSFAFETPEPLAPEHFGLLNDESLDELRACLRENSPDTMLRVHVIGIDEDSAYLEEIYRLSPDEYTDYLASGGVWQYDSVDDWLQYVDI